MSPKESDTQPIPLPFRAHPKTAIGSARGCTQSPVPDAARTRAVSIYFAKFTPMKAIPGPTSSLHFVAYSCP